MEVQQVVFPDVADDKREPSARHHIAVSKNDQQIFSCRAMVDQLMAAGNKLQCPAAEHLPFLVQMGGGTAQPAEAFGGKGQFFAVLCRRYDDPVEPELIGSDVITKCR